MSNTIKVLWCASGFVIHTYFWASMGALKLSGPGFFLWGFTIPHSLLFGPLMLLIDGGTFWLLGLSP